MKKASISSLMAKARRAPGTPLKRAGDIGWSAYVPYYGDQPGGPTTEVRSLTYEGIRAKIRASRARIFLALAQEAYNITHPEWDEEAMWLTYRIGEVDPMDRLGVYDWEKECRALVSKYRNK